MRYVGSKRRIAKSILPLMVREGVTFVEPFAGGFNLTTQVDGPRIAADCHRELIALFTAVQAGWVPPTEVTEDQYRAIKAEPNKYAPELVGFVGFGCSFGGKWWGGYAREERPGHTSIPSQSSRSLVRQAARLQGVDIRCGQYYELELPKTRSTVYCDPPYRNTQKYRDTFDHDLFWEWVRDVAKDHDIFVSEYTAPQDFRVMWASDLSCPIDRNSGKKRGVEKLFTYDGS